MQETALYLASVGNILTPVPDLGVFTHPVPEAELNLENLNGSY